MYDINCKKFQNALKQQFEIKLEEQAVTKLMIKRRSKSQNDRLKSHLEKLKPSDKSQNKLQNANNGS